jgi:3D (Asp-Asp-Asp) domain-containing protein
MRTYSLAPIVAVASLLCAASFRLLPQAQERDQRVTAAVIAGGKALQVRTAARTVGDLLAESGITLGPLDRIEPSLRAPVTDRMQVRVTRVTRRHEVERVTVPGRTVVLADPERPAGFTKVLERGQDGLQRRVVRYWQKDGEVTKKEVVKQQVLVPARDTVVLRGTRGLPSRGGDWRNPLRMHATAYDPGPRSCGKYASGYTAIGMKAKKGVVAVDDRVIPMGTRLYIPGYGFAVAGDRGSAIKGKRIDLCFATYWEARQWGRRKVNVYVLE